LFNPLKEVFRLSEDENKAVAAFIANHGLKVYRAGEHTTPKKSPKKRKLHPQSWTVRRAKWRKHNPFL
jgi:hypothetical protein